MNRYKVNLDYQKMIDEIEGNDRFEINVLTNKVLLTGDAAVVERFYKEEYAKFRGKYDKKRVSNYFWHNVGPRNARVFFGIVKMINDTMVKLVTNGGLVAKVMNGKEEAVEESKRLNMILEKNDFEASKWGLCESFQSGYGYGSFKISYDKDIVDVPIIEVLKPEITEVVTRRGFKTGYIFKERVTVGSTEYEVREIYYKENQSVYIKYEVWNVDSEPMLMKFSEIDNDLRVALSIDWLEDEIVEAYSTLNKIPVQLKNNTAYNSWFPTSPYGEADTQGLETTEDALSEVLSGMIDEIRKGKIKVLISETLLQMTQDGQAKGMDDFKLDYEIIKGDEANGKPVIQIIQGEINSEKYLKTIAQLIMYACNKAGLHPITLGLTGVESIAASQESQTEREKVSLRTREDKLKKWRKSLQDLFTSVLQVDDVMNERPVQDYTIQIDFGEFSNPTPESMIDALSKAITSGVLSIQEAQDQYFDEDKTPEEKELAYIQTLVEKSLPITPQQAALYNGTTVEEEIAKANARNGIR